MIKHNIFDVSYINLMNAPQAKIKYKSHLCDVHC